MPLYLTGDSGSGKTLLIEGRFAPRSVRTVVLCAADDAVLRPIAGRFGIEVVDTGRKQNGVFCALLRISRRHSFSSRTAPTGAVVQDNQMCEDFAASAVTQANGQYSDKANQFIKSLEERHCKIS